MPKKIILDVKNSIWKEVKLFKINAGFKNNNDAVIELIRRGLNGHSGKAKGC